MDTVLAWGIPLVALLLILALLLRTRRPDAPAPHRAIVVAIVGCVALGAVLDAVM